MRTFAPQAGPRRRFGAGRRGRTTAGRAAAAVVPVALVFVSACGTRLSPPPPLPDAVGRDAPAASRRPASRLSPPLPRPVAGSPPSSDAILGSPWAAHEDVEDHVERWMRIWRNRERGPFERALVRMGRYEDFVSSEIALRGMPPSLKYLPLIEGGYYPKALSRVGAGGIWQFMPETARWLGLEVGPLVDERFDPYLATPVALGYLTRLHKQFRSWFLALAAYNSGPGRVDRILREHGGGAPRGDGLFWRIRPHLPAETRDFVPKYLAAARVAEDPSAYGFAPGAKDAPLVLDTVAIHGAASIDVMADAAGISEDTIRFLNPHLLRGLAPEGATTVLRLPMGVSAAFSQCFAAIPPAERVTFHEHTVAAGETLWDIARRYDAGLEEIQAANASVEPRRMRIGTVLVIPRVGRGAGVATRAGTKTTTTGKAAAESPAEQAEPTPTDSRVHVVAPGESLWLIARLYGVAVARLRSYNGLEGDLVHVGDKLRIPPVVRQPDPARVGGPGGWPRRRRRGRRAPSRSR